MEYIISTEALKDVVTKAKLLVVNPILNDRERYRIIKFLGISSTNIYNSDILERILTDINDYIIENKRDEVREIIKNHLPK